MVKIAIMLALTLDLVDMRNWCQCVNNHIPNVLYVFYLVYNLSLVIDTGFMTQRCCYFYTKKFLVFQFQRIFCYLSFIHLL